MNKNLTSNSLTLAEKADLSLRLVRESVYPLSFDTEGSGLDWKRNFPVGYVFYVPGTPSIYVPVRHGGGGNLTEEETPSASDSWSHQPTRYERELTKAFRDREAQKRGTIGHNLKFDCHFAANAGIMLGRQLSCTQLNAVLLNEYNRSYSLDTVARDLKVTAKKGEELYQHLARLFPGVKPDRSSMAHFWRTSGTDRVAVEYAEGDGVTTWEVYQQQVLEMTKQDLLQIKQLEDDLIWTLFRMERRGVRVDTSYLEELKKTIHRKVGEALDSLPEGFNPRSAKDVRELCEAAGRTDWPVTEKGNPSFTEKFLKTFPEGQHVVGIRKNTNLINTFVEPLMTQHVYKGRVHANFNQLKTGDYGTPARLSCNAPNLQQVPKRNKELAKLLRAAFVPDPGYKFWDADYSQAEPRLFAHYSKEPALIKGYSETPFRDMHQAVADLMGVERDPTGKRMNQGMLTGMFPKTFAEHMGWDIDKATRMWHEWFEAFPGIKDFQDGAKAVILARGYVKTLLGRHGRLESRRLAYKATSKLIQGGSADIMKYKLWQIDKWLEDQGDPAHLLISIHDSAEFQCEDNADGDEIARQIVAMMADLQSEPFNLRVPFVVDVDSGKNWCEATYGTA